MIEDPATHALRPFDFSHLMENVPKVKMLNYDIDNIQFTTPIDSSDMNTAYWQEIARSIADNYYDYDGFVVLHGTDTMAYTASALSFMLDNLQKPVIITGSQLPIGERSEERRVGKDYLWRGNRATKRSADNFNAFKSGNYPHLAKVGLSINFFRDALMRHQSAGGLNPQYNLDPAVAVIDLYPGLSESVLRHVLQTPDIKGIVLRTYGAGNAPTASWFIDMIKDTVDRGIVILNVTQCAYGGVHPNRYVAGDVLAATGVIPGYDITFEAAVTKMMFLFGLGLDSKQVKFYLERPLAGEMTIS